MGSIGINVISSSRRKSKSTESSPLRALKTPSWMKRIKTNNLNTTLRSSKASDQALLLEKIKKLEDENRHLKSLLSDEIIPSIVNVTDNQLNSSKKEKAREDLQIHIPSNGPSSNDKQSNEEKRKEIV